METILQKKVRHIDEFTIIPEIVGKIYENSAANQLGWNCYLVDIYTRNYEEEAEYYTFVNTEILQSEGDTILEEGYQKIHDIHT